MESELTLPERQECFAERDSSAGRHARRESVGRTDSIAVRGSE